MSPEQPISSGIVIDRKNQPSVIAHIEMMQSIISRLADNSAKCKEWCFTLIAALVVFMISNQNSLSFSICYWVLGVFYFLDSYYLGLEREMRNQYEKFVKSLNKNEVSFERNIFFPYEAPDDTVPKSFFSKLRNFLVKYGRQLWNTFLALFSFSTLIPYLAFLICIIVYSEIHPNLCSLTNG